MSENVTTPTFLGMVLCDNVLQDPETRKYFLLGTATQTFARTFPARYQKMCVYIVVTGIHNEVPLSIRVTRIDSESGEEAQLGQVEGKIKAPDPLAVAELTLNMRNLVFPEAGQYHFQLWSGETLLGERRFLVKQIQSEA